MAGWILCVGILLSLPAGAASASGVTVGEPPPTFRLINEEGTKVDIGDLMDRPTIIYFTHNSCFYCTEVIAELKRASARYGQDKLRILAINVMAKDRRLVRAYKEELGFIFPMFAGNRPDVLEAYKIAYVPVLVFVDRHRIVRKVVGHYILEKELHAVIEEIMGP